MTTLGFENYVGPLKSYLNSYRETDEGEKNISMARQEGYRSSPANTSTTNNHSGVNEINNASINNSISSKADFQGFNGGFYSLGARVTPQSIGASGRVIGYGENLVIGPFICE